MYAMPFTHLWLRTEMIVPAAGEENSYTLIHLGLDPGGAAVDKSASDHSIDVYI
jgi:hypothetical protein